MNLALPIGVALAVATITADLSAQRFQGRRRPPREEGGAAPVADAPKAERKVSSWTAITGGDVHIGDGNVLRGATILIGDDRIEKVGHDIEIPEKATRIDAAGKVVAPGFCVVRMQGVAAGGGSEVRDDLNPFDPSIKMALAAGITSFLWQSGGGSNTPAGKSAIVKLAWGDLPSMVKEENTVVSMRVPLDASSMANLRKLVRQARDHLDKVREFEGKADAKPEDRPKPPQGVDDLLAVMQGRKKLWISAGSGGGGGFGGMMARPSGGFAQKEVRQALEVAELVGQGVVLDVPVEAWVVPDEVAATGSMAIVMPRLVVSSDPGRPDDTGSNIAQAAILDAAGVPISVTVPTGGYGGGATVGTGGILGRDLHTPFVDAAFAVRGGYPSRKALRILTLDAARISGAERRVGSIEAGKDADILILDGDPLNYKTFVQSALVNGKVVYRKDEEPFYRHIQR
ncbi:MAG: amidohydrolase family protein [Planctomycetes bacterium]|nr:amidohydrolase family protein [Planctomycetota bacterium]